MPRSSTELVSVIVANYNYGRYLREAVHSVLDQDYEPLELIVVDDGSTDDSRAILESIDSPNLQCRFRQNGGQASAWNDGYGASKGSIVVFLDADDTLVPGSIRRHVEALSSSGVVRSQGCLPIVTAEGERTGITIPETPATLDPLPLLLRFGPSSYICVPASGNAWKREFLENVFPLPSVSFGADALLFDIAPLFGQTTITGADVAQYRKHGSSWMDKNRGLSASNLRRSLQEREARSERIATFARARGYDVNIAVWASRSWREQLMRDLLARLERSSGRPSIPTLLRAAWSSPAGYLKRVALLLVVLAIKAAPLPLAIRIAGRFRVSY
jgi:glycosyltransferase involved in cell wall biosynthesis